ncbi:MAG: DEAD/DEAH box helicase [Archangium gephyra]|uniref:DEAD/DEAH box helicase n=1 Tax=Archangium gephyra TaxID=48 RepID=A0A2W5T125_9BACT|nr:MAG: DEAD/DEAH box helicase [Archangium gephyra]
MSASLRQELQRALNSEAAQYHSVQINSVASQRLEDGLVVLQPIPAAQPDWVGGRVLAFHDNHPAWSGDVVHVDPETGDVFLAAGRVDDDALNRASEWLFKPYDFSEALLAASASTDERLDLALQWVHDGASSLAKPGTAESIDGPWSAEWGLLWGPPGTGKTQALATKIADEVITSPSKRLLIIAPTNGAVDELTHRLCSVLKERRQLFRDGVPRVMRCGVGVRSRLAREFPQCVSYDDATSRADELSALEKDLSRLEAADADDVDIARARAAVAAAARTNDATLNTIKQDEVSVIAITVHRALRLANELNGQRPFSKLILDEGGMVSRAAAAFLAPLADTVLIAGDPRQLGPVSRAPDGAISSVQKWLRDSPLSHLRDASQLSLSNVHLLRTQHRMHPHIARVVSHFQYDGQLLDGERPQSLAREAPAPKLPDARAVWVVLDECTSSARALTHDRPGSGRGYLRRFSAELLVNLASHTFHEGHSLLAATPYRAQAQLINELHAARGSDLRLTASTIHRQQGAEFDVVFIDTVAAGRPFQALDLCAMLNVAASRARRHLFVLSSRAEAEATIPARFLSSLQQMRFVDGVLEPVDVTLRREAPMPRPVRTLGTSIDNARSNGALFTEAQVKLFERHFGDGHYLVRGVAGSGKTFVLANWVARVLAEHKGDRVLVSFFNKSLAPLQHQHLRAALERQGLDVDSHLSRVRICHVNELPYGEEFDAVFVDEAQDMDGAKLRKLFLASRERLVDGGKRLRRFFLFMDDAQNVYGVKPIEDFKVELHRDLNFTGRSQVMKESFRSPRELLDLAFNVVLDPQKRHDVAQPGMKEFLKENELVKSGLLQRPSAANHGLYRVDFTERTGALPVVIAVKSEKAAKTELARVVNRLINTEQVKPRDILVVSPQLPISWASALWDAKVNAQAFGGKNGRAPSEFPVGEFDFVRVTTLFSCKGHECPVVIFCGLEDLDTLDLEQPDERTMERQRRALFYVGATRATHRQYFIGLEDSRFVKVAQHYVDALGRC